MISMKYIVTVIILLLFVSCSKKKDDTNTPGSINLKEGTWRVSFYWDTKDETSDFAGYALMFGDGGVLMAHKGASMYTGTWSQTSTKLTINFTDATLSELNDDWLITESSSSLIKLKDDNPAQDDQLHLAKN
jgi:hypothetical protein